MEADVRMIVLVSGCTEVISLLVDPGLDVQQISDSVLPSLVVCVKVVAELCTTVCGVVMFTFTMVMFPVDGAEVLIFITSSVDVASVVWCGCDVGIVTLGWGVVIVVLFCAVVIVVLLCAVIVVLMCAVVIVVCGVVSIIMVLIRCSLDGQTYSRYILCVKHKGCY